MVVVRLGSPVVSSVGLKLKAAHDSHSCSQSVEIVGVFGSDPVARRQVITARIIPPGVESTRSVAMALRLSVGGKMQTSNQVEILAKSVRRSSRASSSESTSDG